MKTLKRFKFIGQVALLFASVFVAYCAMRIVGSLEWWK